ncbi:hypothetical protein KC966_12140, partial [Proteus terrae]|uniref:hypothetical protein n=1 Tax=Proteus terrae TaxID=1574161 RepID=UPI0033153FF9
SHSEYFNAPHVGMALGTLLYTIPFIFLTITMFSPLYKKIKFSLAEKKQHADHDVNHLLTWTCLSL